MSRIIGLSFLPFLYRFPAPTCSAGCEADLPEVNFDDCLPVVIFSVIVRIFLAKKTAAPFTDWTAAGEWVSRISANSTGADAIRVLTVIADKPAGAGVIKEISNGRRITIGKDHTLNFTIDDVSDENYQAMRQLECGGEYKMWYETLGEKMFGGNEGILVRVDVNNVLGRGRDEIEVINGVFSWRAKFHPERTASPIFGSGTTSGGTPPPTTFDSVIAFNTSANPPAVAGVTGATTGTDPEQKLEFNAAPTAAGGTSQTMDININGVLEASFVYLSGRNGDPFRYTSKANTVHTGTFANATKNF